MDYILLREISIVHSETADDKAVISDPEKSKRTLFVHKLNITAKVDCPRN
jgi:hypothetical protein